MKTKELTKVIEAIESDLTAMVKAATADLAKAHPGAVAVLDDGVSEDGSVFLVMDLLVGMSLHQRQVAARGVLPADEVLRIARQLLSALGHLHRNGVSHCDVKPEGHSYRVYKDQFRRTADGWKLCLRELCSG